VKKLVRATALAAFAIFCLLAIALCVIYRRSEMAAGTSETLREEANAANDG